ncbi:MAG: NUDIX hydrolase [Eubacterium sp.]|nr:NUDIX hydrolase [Eubacterium sp.]
MPDGSINEPYYSYSRRDYAVIVALDEQGNCICVQQYRHGIKQVTTEFCAGGIERTDGKEYGGSKTASEDALAAAQRELLEETGYESNEWQHLMTIPSNATIADNYAHLFLAKNCKKVAGQSLDDNEFLDVITISKEQLSNLIKNGEFQQAMHVLAWMLAGERL